jgi:hypothetical protein
MLNPSSCSEKFRDSATKYHIAALLTLGLFFTIAFCQSDDSFSSVFSFAGALTSVITITIAKSKKFSNLLYEKISKTIKMIVKFFKRKIPNTSFKNFIKLNQQPTEFIQFGIEHPPRTILA